MAGSVSFDRAASFYDQTRMLPQELEDRQTALLAETIGDRSPVLEIGVGTGRIAVPLIGAGISVTGIDISRPMLARMRTKIVSPLVVGDATRLPFADGCFGAVLACHVLHLVPGWRELLKETHRVLEADGLFCQQWGGRRAGWPIMTRLLVAAGVDPTTVVQGATDNHQIDAAAIELGFEVTILPELKTMERVRLAEWLEGFVAGVYSVTWDIDPDTRRVAAAKVWAEITTNDPDPVVEEKRVVAWRSYRK